MAEAMRLQAVAAPDSGHHRDLWRSEPVQARAYLNDFVVHASETRGSFRNNGSVEGSACTITFQL